jgi:hypothetical protein
VSPIRRNVIASETEWRDSCRRLALQAMRQLDELTRERRVAYPPTVDPEPTVTVPYVLDERWVRKSAQRYKLSVSKDRSGDYHLTSRTA